MNIRKMTTAWSLIGLLAGFAQPALAQQRESDKLDIKKLEDKYWSAKDDDFSVVQNRAFPKAKRFYGTLHYGMPVNDPYSDGSLNGLSLGYHFSERWGLEGTFLGADYKNNDAVSQFVSDHGTSPNHNRLKSMRGLQVNYVPLYAKMSFLDKKIIYFDMGIGLGLGQTTFTQNIVTGDKDVTEMNYSLSLYQHFFFSEHFAFKFDFRNTWTSEERMRYKLPGGTPESERSLGKKSINDTMLLFGITFFL